MSTKLKITSWNIWERCHFDLVKDFLQKNNADFFNLQEVLLDDETRNVAGFLKSLGYKCAISPSVQFTDENNKIIKLNNAVFSKYQILANEIHYLSESKKGSAVGIKVRIGSDVLNIFSTHLKHAHLKPSEFQNSQVDSLVKFLPKEKTIISGDFNTTPGSYVIEKMKDFFIDSDPKNEPTWGVYSEGCSVCLPQSVETKLDYIFLSKDLKKTSFEVGSSKASDHLPISVIIEI